MRLQGTDYINDWDLWAYPARLPEVQGDVMVTSDIDEALKELRAGGRVLLSLKPEQVAGDCLGTFRPIFWNRITFPKNKVHTLGILCDPEHSALTEFPTETHSTWQWQGLLDGAKPFVLGRNEKGWDPIVRSIDDWNDCRCLGLLLEARVGKGRLMLTSIDLDGVLDQRPVARQLRYSLECYMGSGEFEPRQGLKESQLLSYFNGRQD